MRGYIFTPRIVYSAYPMSRIAIIGSGISGLSFAYFYLKKNPQTHIEFFENPLPQNPGHLTELGPFQADLHHDMIFQKNPALELILREPEISLHAQEAGKDAQTNYIVKDLIPSKVPRSKSGFRFNSILFLTESIKTLSNYQKVFSLWDSMSFFEATKTLFMENFSEYFTSAFTRGFLFSEAENTEFAAVFPDIYQYINQNLKVEKAVESAIEKRNNEWLSLAQAYSLPADGLTPRAFYYDNPIVLKEGMPGLMKGLRDYLKIHGTKFTSAKISSLASKAKTWTLHTKNNKIGPFDMVFTDIDADYLSAIIKEADKELSGELKKMKYNSYSVIGSVYPAKQIRLDGGHILIPRKEKSPLSRVTLMSNLFPQYHHKESFFTKSYLLGEHDLFSDDELQDILKRELKRFTGLKADASLFKVVRLRAPQYFPGYTNWRALIRTKISALENLIVSGEDFESMLTDRLLESSMKKALENEKS